MAKRVQFVFDDRSLVSVEKLKKHGVEIMAVAPTINAKLKRVFLRNNDSGEPAAYCGLLSDKADVTHGMELS